MLSMLALVLVQAVEAKELAMASALLAPLHQPKHRPSTLGSDAPLQLTGVWQSHRRCGYCCR